MGVTGVQCSMLHRISSIRLNSHNSARNSETIKETVSSKD